MEAAVGAAGEWYRPETSIVPNNALPPVTPFTCQVTAVLAVPETVAVNSCVPPAGIVTVAGATTTETGEGVGVGLGDGTGVGVGVGVAVGEGVGVGVGPPEGPEPPLQPAKKKLATEIRTTIG
jgi:hypothetical protein